ncbi:MAG: hypothetical protein WAW07_15740 [Bacteroidales bacterium]
MNNDENGPLHYDLTVRSDQFIGAMNEAERRVKGLSSATVAEGMKIEKAFEQLTKKITTSKELIAATEADIRKMEGMLKTIAPGTAKVDLISEINAAKKALQEQKAALADYEGQVKTAAAAHVSLRTQLRQMKEELVAMEAAGKRGTKEYEVLQESFAKLTQQMAHAQKQANVLAHDQAGFQGLIQALSGVAGIAAAAQGAVGLFAGENEDLQRVMVKVQTLMSLTIGLQQTQQVLNKDSAFSLAVVTRAKTALAAAELNLATALGISTAAARVLMATLTLGLSVAIGVAVAAISRLVTRTQEARKATQEFNKATAEAAYQSLASFEKMRLEWNRLGDDMKAKNKFIKDNKDAFHDLGIQIKGTSDAENVFVKNTETFRTALKERAMAVASYDLASEAYKKFLEKDLEAKTMPATVRRTETVATAGEVQMGPVQTRTIEEENRKRLKVEKEAAEELKKFNSLMSESIKHGEQYQNMLDDLGVTTTENLEKIVLLEQKISEQERLMLEAVEAGNTQEAKLIADRIEQLQEELRIRNLLVNAIYAQSRASELISNSQADAWKPAGSSNITLGAPSTGGKGAGARYWQTPVFDFEAAKKTLSVMDQQAANARNAESVAKKKKKVDDEMLKIAEDEMQTRKEITAAVSETVAMLERAGLLSQEMAAQMQGMIGFAGSIATQDYLGAVVSAVGSFIAQIGQFFDQTVAYEEKIKSMNDVLERHNRLLEQSQRKGGEKDALKESIDLRKKDLAEYQKMLKEEEKNLESHWKNRGNLLNERLAQIEDLKDKINETTIALEDAEQAYTDFLSGGITEVDLASTILEGLKQGRIEVADFAGYMNDMLTEAVLRSFSSEILGPAITELQEMVAQALIDGVLTEEEAQAIQKRTSEIAKDNEEKYRRATQGLGLGDPSDNTLSGAIKGITEQTAGVLAGQVNAMRINQVDGIQIMRQQLIHLAEIALNTRYNRYLASIDSRLAAMSADNLRAQGLNG